MQTHKNLVTGVDAVPFSLLILASVFEERIWEGYPLK